MSREIVKGERFQEILEHFLDKSLGNVFNFCQCVKQTLFQGKVTPLTNKFGT